MQAGPQGEINASQVGAEPWGPECGAPGWILVYFPRDFAVFLLVPPPYRPSGAPAYGTKKKHPAQVAHQFFLGLSAETRRGWRVEC